VAAVPVPARSATGRVRRADLVAVLDRGPGVFLRGVDVRPAFRARRFAGWQVLAFFPDEPTFQSVDLLPGDLVVGVNGRAIERPEDLIDLWQALRTAPAIEVDVVRSGERRKLLYTIAP
jgi:type II secretory pathway component PulC